LKASANYNWQFEKDSSYAKEFGGWLMVNWGPAWVYDFADASLTACGSICKSGTGNGNEVLGRMNFDSNNNLGKVKYRISINN
jgi:hypothetical protein